MRLQRRVSDLSDFISVKVLLNVLRMSGSSCLKSKIWHCYVKLNFLLQLPRPRIRISHVKPGYTGSIFRLAILTDGIRTDWWKFRLRSWASRLSKQSIDYVHKRRQQVNARWVAQGINEVYEFAPVVLFKFFWRWLSSSITYRDLHYNRCTRQYWNFGKYKRRN